MTKSAAVAVWALALAALSAGCATTTGAVPHPFPVPGSAARPPRESPPDIAASSPSTSNGFVDTYALVGTALQLRGVPFHDGGADPTGFDCSGFTQYVFGQHHISLPREVRDQFRVGKAVAANNLAAGDLLFFTTTAPGASHVAIAVGSDEFVHAPSSTGVVRVERLSAAYWSQRYLGARRITRP